MFALFAFGLLFGVVGLLLAVPLAAISGVLTRYALAKYQQSSLYLGEDPSTPPDPEPSPTPARAATPRGTRRKVGATADK
jgi:hypothetical protein